VCRTILTVSLILACSSAVVAGPLPNDPQMVLDLMEGSWRMCMGWRTITIADKNGKTVPLYRIDGRTGKPGKALPVQQSWTPPKNWMKLDYNDSSWQRTRGRVVVSQPARFGTMYDGGNSAEWSYVCLRGRILIKDPNKVMMPKLILRYYGGAVVYVNGVELQRGHLPQGKIKWDTLADPYPKEAYVRPDGRLYSMADKRVREYLDRLALRVRRIPPKGWMDAVAIPNRMLRKGVNVIAIEVHAAPVRDLAIKAKVVAGGWKFGPQAWPHCGVYEAKVTTVSPKALDQNVSPSKGFHVTTTNINETLTHYDYSHPYEKPAPIAMAGARNGTYSGRVLVSTRDAINKLTVKPTELVHADGKSKIVAPRIRYARPASAFTSRRRYPYFDALLDSVPDEIQPREIKIRGRKLEGVPTVTVPVWVTVKVPEDATPGEYTGKVTVSAEDVEPVEVPIKLKVYDWRLPDRKDWQLSSNIYQSPPSVAQYYKVPMWSDKHFELMAKSLDVIADTGSRICVVPLIIRAPNINNTESMVRWVKQADGSYKYDYSRMEKYLDLYAKVVGKPRVLAIYHTDYEGQKNEKKTNPVTVEDAKTGKLSELFVPSHGTPENKAFWKPVLTEVRKRLKKRGWYDRAMIGHVSYCWNPTAQTAKIIKELWPDGHWISTCHGYRSGFGGLNSLSVEWVWASGTRYNPDSSNPRNNKYPTPWRKKRGGQLISDLKIPRGAFRDNHPIPAFRHGPEYMLQHNLHGYGRLGGDFFPVPHPKTGRPRHLCDTKYALGHAISVTEMIAPGPDGAVHSERSECFREGAQMAETVAWVRDMVDSGKATGDLAKRALDLLVTRARHYVRVGRGTWPQWMATESCGARDRDEQLYAIAEEIAKAAK
jgi:glycosyl hydrolase family 123